MFSPTLKSLMTGAALGILCIGFMGSARAQVQFSTGNPGNVNGEENVLLNNGQTGFTVMGTTNTTQLGVAFTSTQQLTAPSNGQARVQASSGNLNSVTISIPGGTFTDLIFNAFIGGSNPPPNGTLGVTVDSSNGGGLFSYSIANGSNFAFLLDPNGTINAVTLTSQTGFSDLREIRISGAALTVPPSGGPTATPEFGSVFSLGGLLAAGGAGIWIKRKRTGTAKA
jgi:hypothetical protein